MGGTTELGGEAERQDSLSSLSLSFLLESEAKSEATSNCLLTRIGVVTDAATGVTRLGIGGGCGDGGTGS